MSFRESDYHKELLKVFVPNQKEKQKIRKKVNEKEEEGQR